MGLSIAMELLLDEGGARLVNIIAKKFCPKGNDRSHIQLCLDVLRLGF